MILPTFHDELEPYAPFEPVEGCEARPQAGVERFRNWVLEVLEGFERHSDAWHAHDWGIVRQCEPSRATSKHNEGRAWDWRPSSEEKADTLIAALMARDGEGNEHAGARRLGLRTLIWRGRIWHSGRRGWKDYQGQNPHDDHVHWGFGWAGARAETSFFRAIEDEPIPIGAVLGTIEPEEESEKVTNPRCAKGTLVETQRTPLTGAQIANELTRAHVALWGTEPGHNRLGVAWAQVMLETGRGKSLYWYNFGNITCGKSWTGEFQELPDGPKDPHFYRAYRSAQDGARDYWSLLERRYKSALVFYDKGQPEKAAHALYEAGYFTAAPGPVGKTFAKLFAEYEGNIVQPSWSPWLAFLTLGAVGIATRYRG